MPAINRKQVKPKQVEYKHDDKSAEYYNSSAWHSLRLDYYSKNPLCECCMAHDVVKSAEHVHHRKPFLRGITDDERWQLLLEPNNLISVCSSCHTKLHTKMKRYGLVMCDELTDKEYEAII
mgnify:CR=1 FL=1